MNAFRDRICVALDVATLKEAETLVSELSDLVGFFKVGFELFTKEGPAAVESVIKHGGKVFLDLKYHDIPNTVLGGIKSASELGCSIVNVHALGGSEMMRAAIEACGHFKQKPLLLAVTVLTSIDDKSLKEDLRIPMPLPDYVLHLALLAKKTGLDGVIASPLEISLIRQSCGPDFFILTPGVRPLWAAKGDQKRIMTPHKAFELGANMVVIGRPITKAANPRESAKLILQELE